MALDKNTIKMALAKKTVKIIAIAVAAVIVVVVLLSLLLGLLLRLRSSKIELEVWPRGADGSANPLISYRSSSRDSVVDWTHRIDDFLSDYRKKGSGSGEAHCAENRVTCNFNTGPLCEKLVCDVPVDDFHPCTSSNQYNYEAAGPCVFLKLNKIFNWKPNTYNTTDDLPKDMPEDLKLHITSKSGTADANMVWVHCEGENPADVENIGPIQYIPRRGFPSYYYPFTNKEGYLSPLVAVLFEKPRTGVLINIECKAWAKNIFYDRYEPRGSVHFELMIDNA